MNRLIPTVSILLLLITLCAVQAQEWATVKSSDGVVEALLPGPAKKSIEKTKSLAGTITTHVMEFRTEDVEFSVSRTRLSKFVRRFANDEKIYRNAKNGVLNKFFGKQTSFKRITVDGVPATELQYEVVDFEDEGHKGYHGVAVFTVVNDTIYSANALLRKDAGDAELKKFRESIKIKK